MSESEFMTKADIYEDDTALLDRNKNIYMRQWELKDALKKLEDLNSIRELNIQ
ncbi:TPA: hypothetical protein J1Z12_004509 [Escherichia coli]|nr:hypothetical protein [Escherichia coli]HAZ3600599.1 hypothetical protein [Escherichia coli]